MHLVNVHLVRHHGCNEELVEKVYNILNCRAVSFHYRKVSLPYPGTQPTNPFSFADYARDCRNYRTIYKVPEGDYVILLTGIPHDMNWFSAMEEKNGFVQVNAWGHFFDADIAPEHPVSYEVAAWILRTAMCGRLDETLQYVHLDARGCTMDFCQNKQDIVLKMRTADLCPQCLSILERKKVSLGLINQVIATWEDIRKSMSFHIRAGFLKNPVNMDICFSQKEIHFRAPSVTVRLKPSEMALYAFVLKHCSENTGIRLKDLETNPDLLRELAHLCDMLPYGNGEQFTPAYFKYTNLEPIRSKIKNKLTRQLNNPELVQKYFIKYLQQGTFTIDLPKTQINWVDKQGNKISAPWEGWHLG